MPSSVISTKQGHNNQYFNKRLRSTSMCHVSLICLPLSITIANALMKDCDLTNICVASLIVITTSKITTTKASMEDRNLTVIYMSCLHHLSTFCSSSLRHPYGACLMHHNCQLACTQFNLVYNGAKFCLRAYLCWLTYVLTRC